LFFRCGVVLWGGGGGGGGGGWGVGWGVGVGVGVGVLVFSRLAVVTLSFRPRLMSCPDLALV
jgi:hypothetical protein